MGIQVAIRGDDDESGTGKVKLHGPTRPVGQGHSKDPYFGFPDHTRPWEGSLVDGLRSLARWLDTKAGLARHATSIKVYHIRRPEEVRGKRARERAERFIQEGS